MHQAMSRPSHSNSLFSPRLLSVAELCVAGSQRRRRKPPEAMSLRYPSDPSETKYLIEELEYSAALHSLC
jgi:hypothetical protein